MDAVENSDNLWKARLDGLWRREVSLSVSMVWGSLAKEDWSGVAKRVTVENRLLMGKNQRQKYGWIARPGKRINASTNGEVIVPRGTFVPS